MCLCCVCNYAGEHVYGCQEWMSGVFLNHFLPYFLSQGLSECGAHQFSSTGWPENPRDPPVSTSPMLGRQVHTATRIGFYMNAGDTKFRTSFLHSKHFSNPGISHLPTWGYFNHLFWNEVIDNGNTTKLGMVLTSVFSVLRKLRKKGMPHGQPWTQCEILSQIT